MELASYEVENPQGGGTSPLRTDIFTYDELGNRMGTQNHVARRGWLEFKRRNNGLNQYGEWYSIIHHDDHFAPNAPGRANGVLMMEGWIGASFNALNQPIAMYSGSTPPGKFLWFGYDPLGRCVKRWLAPDSGESPEPEGGYAPGAQNPAATYLYYDGWNLVQEGTAPSSPTRLYVHGGRVDEVVAQIKPETSQLRYFQYDARGHCVFQTDTAGQIMEQYEYDAFGLPYFYDGSGNATTVNGQPGSPWGNRILFTGREWLSDMRIYDFRHRVYHPELGRFLQPDPKHFGAGDYNLYRYCHNDPVNKSDPTGLEDENYFDNGFLGIGRESLRKWITRSLDDNRTFTIGAHGVEGGRTMWDANRKMEMTPRQLFDRTKNNPELQKAERVMLYSCELGAGGKDSFAQKYADLTGKTVLAPTKLLWVDKKGGVFSAGALPKVDPNNPNEPLRPDRSNPGKIEIFRPHR